MCTQLRHNVYNMYTPSTHHLHNMYATFIFTASRHSTNLHTIHTSCTQHVRNIYKHFYTRYTTQTIATFDTSTHHSHIVYASFPQHLQALLHALRNIYFTAPRHSTHLHTIRTSCTQHLRNIYRHFYTRYATQTIATFDKSTHHLHNTYAMLTHIYTRMYKNTFTKNIYHIHTTLMHHSQTHLHLFTQRRHLPHLVSTTQDSALHSS